MLFPDTCILFDTRKLSGFYSDCYSELKSELDGVCRVIALCHVPKAEAGLTGDIMVLNDDAIFAQDGYHKDISCGIVPGNGDLKLIAAARRLDYSHYVRWEDDVHCLDAVRTNVVRLIEQVEAHDFAASYLTPYTANGWKWWDTLAIPNVDDDRKRKMSWGAFLPLMAMSARFLHAYDGLLRQGWAGHYEVTMATAAKHLGMECLNLSLPPYPFTSPQQFGITEVPALAEYRAPFVHPIKTREARRRLQLEPA